MFPLQKFYSNYNHEEFWACSWLKKFWRNFCMPELQFAIKSGKREISIFFSLPLPLPPPPPLPPQLPPIVHSSLVPTPSSSFHSLLLSLKFFSYSFIQKLTLQALGLALKCFEFQLESFKFFLLDFRILELVKFWNFEFWNSVTLYNVISRKVISKSVIFKTLFQEKLFKIALLYITLFQEKLFEIALLYVTLCQKKIFQENIFCIFVLPVVCFKKT